MIFWLNIFYFILKKIPKKDFQLLKPDFAYNILLKVKLTDLDELRYFLGYLQKQVKLYIVQADCTYKTK